MSWYHYVINDSQNPENLGIKYVGIYDNLQRAFDALQAANGIVFAEAGYEEHEYNEGILLIQKYADKGKKAVLRLITDYSVPIRYVVIEADTLDEVKYIGSYLNKYMLFYSLAQLHDTARKEMKNRPTSLIPLALGADFKADEETMEILSSALGDPDSKVRLKAAESIALTQWPEFASLLENKLASEKKVKIKDMIIKALSACQRKR